MITVNTKQIKSIKKIGTKPVYDISVEDAEHYILENGVVTHNTGSVYNSDNIWIIGRQQDKNEKLKQIDGYDFIINIEKSRYVKEKSKIPISVSFEKGINKWSGMLDLALEGGFVTKPKNGWYEFTDPNTGEVSKSYREAEIDSNDVFWKDVFKKTEFSKWIKEKYTLATGDIIQEDEEVELTEE